MTTTPSRRSILAGAAATPALALPAVATWAADTKLIADCARLEAEWCLARSLEGDDEDQDDAVAAANETELAVLATRPHTF